MMEREKFMQEARLTVHRILEGKENGIMNLVQQAWAEGKRNAEVETLRAAIEEALSERDHKQEQTCAVYPTVYEWLVSVGLLSSDMWSVSDLQKPIPADLAQKLGVEPK